MIGGRVGKRPVMVSSASSVSGDQSASLPPHVAILYNSRCARDQYDFIYIYNLPHRHTSRSPTTMALFLHHEARVSSCCDGQHRRQNPDIDNSFSSHLQNVFQFGLRIGIWEKRKSILRRTRKKDWVLFFFNQASPHQCHSSICSVYVS